MNIINLTKSMFIYTLIVFVLASCKKDEQEETPVVTNELAGLQLAQSITNEGHTISLYTNNGRFQTGYNSIFFQIKDAQGSLVSDVVANWTPVMQMMSMSHSCPYSAITKKAGSGSTYGGFIVFQMAGSDMEYWELTLNYEINGNSYSVTEVIDVVQAPKRVVESFMASDNSRYVMALVAPTSPKVGINDMQAVLYKMETMMSFVPVDDYKIKIDPRMPGMGNHGSPNNVDLTKGADLYYYGKLSMTMTGYWKINLQLENAAATIIKGEAITESNEGSSIYFEVEF